MTQRSDTDPTDGCSESGGVSSFLRSLLAGIPWSESASVEERAKFSVPSARVVELDNVNGKTRVVGEDRDDIQLFAVKHARAESQHAAEKLLEEIQIVEHEVGGTLQLDVDVPRRWNRHGSVDLEICVPRDVEVKVTSSNGKLCMQGLRCGAVARSSNGSVRLTDVSGDIEITTANAKVYCACTRGRLVARSSNGKIELGEHSGSIDASTSNGLIHASLAHLAAAGVTLATSNGRIVLELPEAPDADVDIRVDNGVIRNELALGGETGDANGRLRGRLGRGGTPIKLRTSNGTISMRSSKPAQD
jgi:DUF4097 and DUF4098 domain-containing protein YvlB